MAVLRFADSDRVECLNSLDIETEWISRIREYGIFMYRVCIVIVNYCSFNLVRDCLDSIIDKIGKNDYIIVVDNNSTDDSFERLQSLRSGRLSNVDNLDVLRSKVNSGFSAGNNMGIRHVDSEYYLLLNADTVVKDGAIDELVASAERNPQGGMFGPSLESMDGQAQVSCFRNHTPVSEFINASRTGVITKLLNRYNVPLQSVRSMSEIGWLSYACVLIRHSALESAGFLDERFFLYYEDAEHSRRIRNAGWELMHVHTASVIHLEGGSTGIVDMRKKRSRLPKYFYQSRSLYFRLLYGRTGLAAANISWTSGRIISWLRETVERRPTHVAKLQWLDIWMGFLSSNNSVEIDD